MAKKIQLFEGRPVFQASNSKKLAEAVARYEGEVEPPYVVKLSSRSKEVKAEAFMDDETVGVVLLPESIMEIGERAFCGCTRLTRIDFPENIYPVGKDAFMDCTHLKVNMKGYDEYDKDIVLEDSGLGKISGPQFYREMRQLAKEHSEWKVAFIDEVDELWYINRMELWSKDNPDGITIGWNAVARTNSLPVSYFAGDDVNPAYYEEAESVVINIFDFFGGSCWNFEIGDEGIFFEYKDGEEDIIACRAGHEIENKHEYEEEQDEDEENCRRKHVLQCDISANVEYLISDLQFPVKYNPGSTLSFRDENASDVVISGTRKWKNIVLLQTSWNEDDAITVEELHDQLQKYDEDAGVLLQMFWELRNLYEGTYYPEEELECDGFIGYDHEYGNDIAVASLDIRLFSPSDLEYFMKKFKEECAGWKIACYGDDGKLHLVRELRDDDGTNYIIVNDKRTDSVTVADFLCTCRDESGGMVVAYGKKGILKPVSSQGDIFFKDKLNGEDVIAFRLGDTLYDPEEDDDTDPDSFFSEDDLIVLPED